MNTDKKFWHLSLSERTKSIKILHQKYPNQVAVIVRRMEGSALPELSSNKFIVPKDLSVAQWLYIMRRQKLKINETQNIYFFVDTGLQSDGKSVEIMNGVELMSQVFQKAKKEDGAMYVWYREEDTFG